VDTTTRGVGVEVGNYPGSASRIGSGRIEYERWRSSRQRKRRSQQQPALDPVPPPPPPSPPVSEMLGSPTIPDRRLLLLFAARFKASVACCFACTRRVRVLKACPRGCVWFREEGGESRFEGWKRELGANGRSERRQNRRGQPFGELALFAAASQRVGRRLIKAY
jgi:hypothetical protein